MIRRLGKYYFRGFKVGFALGVAYLSYVYWRAGLFPGDPVLKKFYARVRSLEK
jgi:hypothetical protein